MSRNRIVGKCRYCGQQFMSKPGLAKHERETCPERPDAEVVPEALPQDRWRKVTCAGGATGWIRR